MPSLATRIGFETSSHSEFHACGDGLKTEIEQSCHLASHAKAAVLAATALATYGLRMLAAVGEHVIGHPATLLKVEIAHTA